MKVSTPIEYSDLSGNITTMLFKDGNTQIMHLRGVTFIDNGRDGFKPKSGTNDNLLTDFRMIDGVLCGYIIKFLEKLPRTSWGRQEEIFKDLNVLLDNLDCKIPIQDQQENLEPFKLLTDEQILALADEVKDEAAGMALYYIGPSRMDKILPKLLTNIQDQNWPASGWTVKLLVDIGEELIPVIKNAFADSPNDTIWHENIIWVISNWEKPLVIQLIKELTELILKGDEDGTSISAFEVLLNNEVISENDAKEFYNLLDNKYSLDQVNLEELRNLKPKIKTDNTK